MLSGSPRAETQIGTWTMNISGKVLPTSCDVDGGSDPTPVQMGTIASTVFSSVGDVSPDVAMPIRLTGCGDNIVGAKITFSGTQDADNAQLLALSNTSGSGSLASGVGIELLDGNKTVIPINSSTPQYPLKAGDNTLDFLLHYKATKIPVTGGNGTAVMYFDVSYQ